MQLSNDFLKKLSQARVSKGGNYFRHGKYRLAIRECKVERMDGGMTGVIEFLVLHSEKLPDNQDAPNAKGDKPAIVCQFDKNSNVAFPNFKAPLAAALDVQPDEVAKFEAELNGKDLSDFRGVVVDMETYVGTNKGRNNPANAGKPIVKMNWKAVDQTGEDIIAMRKHLDQADGVTIPG